MTTHDNGNVVDGFSRHVESRPDRRALMVPTAWTRRRVRESEQATFWELSDHASRLMIGFNACGLRPGDRVVLMFPYSMDLYAALIALLAAGMSPVFVDSGMGIRRVLACIRRAGARAIISRHKLLMHRFWLPALWRLKMFSVNSQGLFLQNFDLLRGPPGLPLLVMPCEPDTAGIITFAEGRSGLPFHTDQTHRLLRAQRCARAAAFPARADDIDMPSRPLSVLHNLCEGVTTVLPPAHLRAPVTVDGALLWQQVTEQGITLLDGAPGYIEPLVAHMATTGARASNVRRLVVNGAALSQSLARRIRDCFPHADVHVCYGVLQADPIAVAGLDDVLAGGGEHGFLAGRPVSSVELVVVALPDPPPVLDDRGLDPYRLDSARIGELVVSGPHINPVSAADPAVVRAAQLQTPDGRVWHRTGDRGHVDAQGRLWLADRRA